MAVKVVFFFLYSKVITVHAKANLSLIVKPKVYFSFDVNAYCMRIAEGIAFRCILRLVSSFHPVSALFLLKLCSLKNVFEPV